MSNRKGSLRDFQERLTRKSPASVDLYTARTNEQFETAFEVILEKILTGLEQDKKGLGQLKEDALSSILVIGFNVANLSCNAGNKF